MTLPLYLPKHCRFDNFIGTENALALQSLHDVLKPVNGDRMVYLWGAKGVGKSHLLAAACYWASAHFYTSVYLPMALLTDKAAALLHMEELYCITIDDLDLIAGDVKLETQLFFLVNRIVQHNARLILSAEQPPQALPIHLADLKSRLCAALIFQIKPLGEEGKRQAMINYAQDRGLTLSDEIVSYILNRQNRQISHLLALVARLDEASLANQRRLTIPFVRQVLEEK